MATENLGEPNFEDGEDDDAAVGPDPSTPNPAENPELEKELATDPNVAQEQFSHNISAAEGTADEQVPHAGPTVPVTPAPGGPNPETSNEEQKAEVPPTDTSGGGEFYQCLTREGQPNTDHPVFRAESDVERVQCPVCGSTSVIKTQAT